MGFIPLVQGVLLQERWKRQVDFQVGHLVTHIKSACISLPAILYTSLRVSICHFETSVTWKVIILKCKFWPDFYKDSFYLHLQSGYWYSSDLMNCESTWMSFPIQTLVFTQTTGKLAPVRIATAWHIMHALFCFLRPLAETNRGWASKHLKAGKGPLHACTCSFNIKINIATHCGAWKKQQQKNEKLTVWLLKCKFMLSDQNDTLQSR